MNGRLRRRFLMRSRFAFVLRHLRFALHLQPMLFELLRVERLLRILLRMRLLRPAFTAIASTATAAAAAAAAVTAPALFFATFLRRTVAVLQARLRPLLLRRALRTLIRPAFALRTLERLALCLGKLALLRDLALRAIGARLLLLLRRPLVAAGLLVAL